MMKRALAFFVLAAAATVVMTAEPVVKGPEHGALVIVGGGKWRLADSYLHTRTQREVERVLERGGVVAGSSAGASIISSYMVRGAVENNYIMMAPGYEEGFG